MGAHDGYPWPIMAAISSSNRQIGQNGPDRENELLLLPTPSGRPPLGPARDDVLDKRIRRQNGLAGRPTLCVYGWRLSHRRRRRRRCPHRFPPRRPPQSAADGKMDCIQTASKERERERERLNVLVF